MTSDFQSNRNDRSKEGRNLPSTTGNPSGGNRDNLPPRTSHGENQTESNDDYEILPVSLDGHVFTPRESRFLCSEEKRHARTPNHHGHMTGCYHIKLDNGTVRQIESFFEALDLIRRTQHGLWLTYKDGLILENHHPPTHRGPPEWVQIDPARTAKASSAWLRYEEHLGIKDCEAWWRHLEDEAIAMATEPMP